MGATDLAKAYVQIIPSTKDFSANLAAAIAPELGAVGADAGGAMGAGIAAGALKGKLGLVAAGAAAVKFGKDAIKTSMDFDSAMSQVQATLLTDKKSMEELRQFAMKMGGSTKFTATEAAQALNYMALAGYDAKTSMDMLPTVLDLAAAGNFDLATASDMVTDAQTALGLSLDETRVMVDQMAKTASRSNTSVYQLGDAMLTIGGTAQFLKGGTKELTTLLGLLADNGVKAGEGGTHLRNVLLKLVDPTEDGIMVMNELGVSVFDAEGNMRSMAEFFPELAEALDGLTQEERIQKISTLFNTRDIASANALLGTSRDRWKELGDEIENSAGAAEEMAEIQLDNLEGDVTLLKSAVDNLKIAITDGPTSGMREFVQVATEGIQEVTEKFNGEEGLQGAADAAGKTMSDIILMIESKVPDATDAALSFAASFSNGITDGTKGLGWKLVENMVLEMVGASNDTNTLDRIASIARNLNPFNQIYNLLFGGLDERLKERANYSESHNPFLAYMEDPNDPNFGYEHTSMRGIETRGPAQPSGTVSARGEDANWAGGTVNNIYVENVQTLDQVMDMIENDNRRRRMNP